MGGLVWKDAGVLDYIEAWEYQKGIFQSDQAGTTCDTVILCEHPHVYTLGKSGHEYNMLVDSSFLERIGATFYKTDRGGDITYHGYGQLVGYPILNLDHYGLSLKGYVSLLEESIIQLLSRFDIKGKRMSGATGVWLGSGSSERKICAIGVRASRYVTMHGFALNVNTDLSYFNHIHPCGFVDRGVTSMEKELGSKVDMSVVKRFFQESFSQLLEKK